MVEHIVLFKLKAGTTEEQQRHFIHTLRRLGQIDGIADFSIGLNHSAEGKDKGFQVGMRMLFNSQEALDAYLPSREHVGIVDEVRERIDDVIVVDYAV